MGHLVGKDHVRPGHRLCRHFDGSQIGVIFGIPAQRRILPFEEDVKIRVQILVFFIQLFDVIERKSKLHPLRFFPPRRGEEGVGPVKGAQPLGKYLLGRLSGGFLALGGGDGRRDERQYRRQGKEKRSCLEAIRRLINRALDDHFKI